MLKQIIAFSLSAIVSLTAWAKKDDPVEYVNTLQGTNSEYAVTRGNTYPTTALPFAMHTWSAQTGVNGDGWKYQYKKDSIRAFQQAHQCSSWTRDYCVFSLMPVTGKLVVNQYDRAAKFSHKNETGKPYYYSVKFDNGIRTEMSPVERGTHLRFSFPGSGNSYVVFDGYTQWSEVQIDAAKRRITGYVTNGSRLPQEFKNYFIIEFDQPFVSYGTWTNNGEKITPDAKTYGVAERGGAGVYIQFRKGAKVQARVVSSYISPEQAEVTFNRELASHTKLEQTKEAARTIWNTHLNRMYVESGTDEDKATFYSCFFRASLFSRKFFEISAEGKPVYRSPNDYKIYNGYYYTDTGFWDTFRGQFPLTLLLHPTMQGQYVAGMLDAYDQAGWLPDWDFPSVKSGMIGNHAISLFADAWTKGVRTFDPNKALEAYFHQATNREPGQGRDGWQDYWTLGYVSYPGTRESTAKTLEYTYDDWCAYNLAKAVGNDFYKEIFERQVYNYRNVWDASTGFMRGRGKDGEWTPNFDPIEWGGPFTEGCAWHYNWSVFHDPEGLKELMGGDNQLVQKMDDVFTATNEFKVGTYGKVIHEMTEMKMMNLGQYAHGNQPIQHMIYLYSYTKQPWKAQYWARRIMSYLYNSTENGYPGDEDQGQTSSWYVLSAMGLYSVCPGTDQYVLGSPKFPKMTVTFEDGKQLQIIAENNSPENIYIQSATLNGIPFTKNYLTYKEITDGGVLKYVMGPEPNKNRGINPEDWPYSFSLKR